MEHNLEQFVVEIQELLRLDDRDGLRETLDFMRVQDIAWVLMELGGDDLPTVFNRLPPGRKADVFGYLAPGYQVRLLGQSPRADARFLLSEMDTDDLTALLQDLDEEQLRDYLRLLPFRAIRRALKQLNYPGNSVGRVMSSDVVAVELDWSTKRALAFIRRNADEHTNNVIFVVDDERRLVASIPIRHFLRGRPDDPVETLLPPNPPVTVSVLDDPIEAARRIQHYDLETLPVVGEDGVLLGVVTVDDVVDLLEAESTEDFHKMGSVGVLPLSLQNASPLLLFQKRVGWLLVLVAFNAMGGYVISRYEEAIEALVALVFFLPLIIASAGNAGAQSSTLMVRALATGDVSARDWLKLWGKEIGVSVSLGATMGIAVSMVGLWRGGFDLALLVAIAMSLIVAAASILGMLLPLILNRFKLDPATASVPLVTSLADVFGILIYFALAVAIFNLTIAGA
ncbi:Magnesium transporter [Thioalkalivibrio nitratireducens DSM 14787]|uniref:Magnesium transporter MgtE n=1 Tax=Thioalkalivibrio nitratireducens (strain DSM 14787 / UNIQEM 213 / ALEN2) TaxID=1255043 RepID=L0DYE8_THIND|nr:magnesium transporter [Thioalkalivibrio nitratireducens]AGA34078.1 Magnesium transporter [Thioalkalivibrio nitratireducens DSM 14787]